MWEAIDALVDCRGFNPEVEKKNKQTWNELQLRILSNCLSIWGSVKDVLCNDSPEGHLPEDLDDMPTIDTKDVLSYSFRAIHESRYVVFVFLDLFLQAFSNLMRTMVSKSKEVWHDGSSILPAEVFMGIGNLTFEQLSNLRHRGAFSTVSLTFTRCCQTAPQQDHDQPSHHGIIKTWYKVYITYYPPRSSLL